MSVCYQKFYFEKCPQISIIVLMEVVCHVQSIQNRKLVIFFQYINKKLLQLLFCSIVMQNIQIFYGGTVMFVVICLYICTLLMHFLGIKSVFSYFWFVVR